MITAISTNFPCVFGYGRRSDETGRQELTEAVQKDRCDIWFRHAKESGAIPENARWAGWFFDSVTSGVNWFHREQAQEIFRRLRRGDRIVVAKLDRCARSQKDWCISFDMLKEAGVSLSCCEPNINFDDPFGEMYAQIIMAVAQNERSQIRSRTKAALYQKRLNNKPNNQHAPIGWRKVGKKGESYFKPDHEERALCNEMVRMYDSGISLQQIMFWARGHGLSHRSTCFVKRYQQKRINSRSGDFCHESVRVRIMAARAGFPLKPRKELRALYVSVRASQSPALEAPVASDGLP